MPCWVSTPCGSRAGALARPARCWPRSASGLLVRANAGVMVGAGTLLALGRFPRLSALALAGSLIPTTLAGHLYWTIEDPATRKIQRIQFHKNLAMLGGLLLAVLDEQQGRPAGQTACSTSPP